MTDEVKTEEVAATEEATTPTPTEEATPATEEATTATPTEEAAA